MDKAGLVTDLLGKFSQKGDDIVVCCSFNFINAINPRRGVGLISPFPNSLGGVNWNNTKLCLSITSMGLNLEPKLKLVGGFPNFDHFGAAIAWDHFRLQN